MDDQGKTIILTGCVLDGTAQKLANLNLIKRTQALELAKENKERFSAFALSAPAGIYIYGVEGELLYRNPKFWRLWVYQTTPPTPTSIILNMCTKENWKWSRMSSRLFSTKVTELCMSSASTGCGEALRVRRPRPGLDLCLSFSWTRMSR